MSDDDQGGQQSDSNRRKHPRYELSLLVQLRFNDFEDFLAEYVTNISVGGMFIRTDTPRRVGASIYVQFYLSGGQKLIEGLVKVVRAVPAGLPGRQAGMAVEFVSFDDESMAVIEEVCEARRLGKRPAP